MVINRLKLFRLESGMTQKELAKVAGCSQAHISAIENGKAIYISNDLINKFKELGYNGGNPREVINCNT